MKLVYRYALASPHENAELVFEQIRLAHRYRNALVEIEHQRRAEVRAAEAAAGDMPKAIAALRAARGTRELAVMAITRHRARTRKRDEPAEFREAAKQARVVERDAARAFSDVRKTIATNQDIINARDLIGEKAKASIREARGLCGVFWGTYLLVEAAAGESFAETGLYDSAGEPTDPHFLRWTGEGAVAVQLQGGMTVAEATSGQDTRLRLRLPDPWAWDRKGRTHRECEQMARQAEVSLRVGSEGRAPVWATWRCDMHRPLPMGAVIKWAAVHREKVGPHDRWYLTLTLEADVRREASAPPRRTAVAVDIGWRVIGDELRVAGWMDTDGRMGELRLSAKDREFFAAANRIQAERGVRFDAMRARLSAWLREHNDILPDWLRVTSANMASWKSEGRLAGLYNRWRDNRFVGDTAAYDQLSNWAARARHEWAVESRTREQAILRRREKYRIFAAQMAEGYDFIVIEKFDLRTMAVRQAPDQDSENETARTNRVVAATSILVNAIKVASRSRGTSVAAMPCEDTTRECPMCHLVSDRRAEAQIVLSCTCGHVWDQDVNGAPSILLDRWRKRPGDAKMAVSARNDDKERDSDKKGEGRWAKAKRMRVEKEARMAAAREAAGNVVE